MLSTMTKLASNPKTRFRRVAATALFALASRSPSAASFSPRSSLPSSSSRWRRGISSRGGGGGGGEDGVVAKKSLLPPSFSSTTTTTTTTTTARRSHSAASSSSTSSSASSSSQRRRRSSLKASTAADLSSESSAAAAPREAPGDIAAAMGPAEKLEALRAKMKELDLDVFIVPSDDPHLSEYVPEAYMRRKFMTGFGGSAGTALVTQEEAHLWTDSRYWNEASLTLDASLWTLQKQGQPKVKTIPAFLGDLAADRFENHGVTKVGIDPFVHPASFAKELEEAFASAAKKKLDRDEDADPTGTLDTSHPNLIDPIWGDARPEVPYNAFRPHPLEFAGASVADKVEKVRKEMKENKATMAVFGALDDVAYLLNVRAMGDVDTCPVGIAYATVTNDGVVLYCDSRKVESPEVKEHLKEVTIKEYDAIVDDVKAHCETDGNKVWMDCARSNLAISSVIPEKVLIDAQNAVTPMKACKNDAELEGMRRAHVVDGAAMAEFVSWLEDAIVGEGGSVSEVEIDRVLTSYRAEQPGFLECSFPTIAGVGPNAAIIHYRAVEGDDVMRHLDASQPVLIDSGGQYTYGTTDVTRTWHFGEATEEFKDTYTRVLKGNIGVDTAIFPEGTPGFVLDVFARKALWEAGKDYGHGTGHGVGAALNVHEGPQSISPRFGNKEGLKKGMVVSNEPGYYEDGNFGIRIENLLEIQYVKPEHNDPARSDSSDEKKYLKFDRLTMIPIQKNLIKLELMTGSELDWLDDYHAAVLEKVGPLLEPDGRAMEWLKRSCEKMERDGSDDK